MPNKRKLVKDGAQESPYSKRSRRTKPNQSDIAEKILETIKSHQKEDGSTVASTFLKVPSKRHNPEYHEAVPEPIDLSRITQRLRMDEYRDIESLTADVDLLVNNAKKFYEEDSSEYQDADALWELYIDTKTLIMAGDITEEPANEELINKIDDIYNSLLAEVDEEGQGLTDMFMVLPDSKIYPDYYQKIKEPIDFTTIGEKIQRKEYRSVSDFEKDAKQLIKNARSYNEPNSKIYNNAVALKNVLQDRLQSDAAEKTDKSEIGVKTSARLKQRLSAKLEYDGGLKRQDAVDMPESGLRSSRTTVLLQASITDTNLKERENLQAKFYNEVVNYRNPLGHSISDAFVRLPNKHHYPAYYEEIENPISLKTIRRNIITGKHRTFEDLAEEFRLLFENAKQYNKEGSQIYKNAQTLSNIMEGKLSAFSKLEEELEGSDEEEDEEEGDDEEEDGDEEKEEEGQDEEATPDGKNRKRKDSIISRGSGQKEKPQNRYRKQLRSLYDTVQEGAFEGRNMVGLFMEKPSRKDYPDYYKLILEPIDMKAIDKNIRQDKYPTVSSLVEDFTLMFTNARHYNEPGSEVYQDADRLQEMLRKKQQELPSLSMPEAGPSASGIKADIFSQKTNPLVKSMEHIYHAIRDYRDPMGREICEIFNKLPSKLELPDYYQVIKKPMDSDRITQKIQANIYLNLSEFLTDVLLMFENACLYNEPGSLIYKDALILQKIAVEAYQKVMGNKDVRLVRVRFHVQELLTNLFVSVVNHQDEDGRCYSDSLLTSTTTTTTTTTDIQENSTPAPDAMETSESVPAETTQSQAVDDKEITLEIIRRNLHARRYKRLDVFQDHMFEVFESSRKSNRTDCEVYEDAVELQRFFIRIRDELCKNGETLMSPALTYTAKHMQNDLDAEKQEKLPGEALEDEAGNEEGKEMRENIQKLSSTDGMDVQGVTYQPGDFVYVENTAEPSKPQHIVCIEKLYQEETGEHKMYGVWFFRPQATYHLQTRRFLIKEVFKSDYYNTVPVSNIKGKCFVMLVKDYFKQKPVGYLEDDVYVCVSRYTSRMKSFKRIKLLNLPQNNTKIIQREKALVPVRVSSVYSEDSRGDMKMPKLSDMHGPLVTDNKPWPKDIIDKEKLDIKIENIVQDIKPAPQTYYLQYNMPSNKLCLKVGDCVYVKQRETDSDQRLKIARIESMWLDVNNQMWFQGSWFAQPCDTEHEPTRMFYKNEVFLLSFNSPNSEEATATTPPPTPLSWVVSVCCVLSVREMMQCRPTELRDMHIHVCESRYLASDKYIRKIKGALKKPAISHKVVEDEYYYFKSPVDIMKEVSPLLATSVRQELSEREVDFVKEQEESKKKALQAQQQQPGMVIGAQYPPQINPMMQPGPPRQYSVQQYQQPPYQQHTYQQQPYVTHPPPQQYIVTPSQPQGVSMQPTYQYQPTTPYVSHPQMHPGVPQPAGTPLQVQLQMQPQYHPVMQPPLQYTPGQSGIQHMTQSPIQSGVRQTNTPIDRVETPGSSGSGTPTTTKKKNRGGHSTGYILFASQCHPRMRAENPTMPFGDISKLVGEEWRSQTDEKKREYEEKARELSAKAEAEGRPMQGKKKKKQQLRREMEEAAAAAQAQQHPPPQPHVMMQQQVGAPVMVQPYSQAQYHTGQYPVPQPGYQPGMPATPQHGTPQQYPGQTPQMVSTPAGQPQTSYVVPGQVYATPLNTSTADQVVYMNQPSGGMRRGPLFVKPPPKVQRVLHSEAYLRYIDSLEKGNRNVSHFERTLSIEEKDVELSQGDMAKLPAHWLANGKGKHETVKSALWSLRDLMLKDALAIKNHFV